MGTKAPEPPGLAHPRPLWALPPQHGHPTLAVLGGDACYLPTSRVTPAVLLAPEGPFLGPHGLHLGKPAEPLGKGLPSTRRDSQEPRSHSKQSPAAQTQIQRIEKAEKCFISLPVKVVVGGGQP